MPFEAAQGFAQGLDTIPQYQMALANVAGKRLSNQADALKLQQDQKMSQLISQQAAKGTNGQSPADIMMGMASLTAKAGLPQAIDLYTKAADISEKQAQVKAQQLQAAASQQRATTEAQHEKLLQHQQNTQAAYGMLNGVQDQASFNNFAQQFYSLTGDPSYIGKPYSPQLVAGIRSEALGAKAQIDEALKKLTLSSTEAWRNLQAQMKQQSLENQRDATDIKRAGLALQQQRVELERQRETRLAKAGGGKGISPPPQIMVDQANELIRQQFPDMVASDKLMFAMSVASQARKIMQTQKGTDAQAAIMQAISEQKNEYVETKPGFFSNKQTFNPKGNKGYMDEQNKQQFPNAPDIGMAKDGYVYEGGDPADQNSWRKQ